MILTLHFFHMKGCAYCIAGAKYLETFERRQKSGSICIIRHRMDLIDYPIQGWTPGASPAYALVVDGTLLATREGVLDESGLTKFCFASKVLAKKKVKDGARQKVREEKGDEDDEEEDDEGDDE